MSVLNLSLNQTIAAQDHSSAAAPTDRPDSNKIQYLLTLGNEYFVQGAYAEAITFYQDLVELDPRHADALNNLGAALCFDRTAAFYARHFFDSHGRARNFLPSYSKTHADLHDPARNRS